jgi:translocation and assembly module TamB
MLAVMAGKWRRRLIGSIAAAAAGLVAAWCLLPLWLPWALSPLARLAGVKYEKYERKGYQRFVLHRVSYVGPAERVTVERLEALVPHIWLWRLATSSQPAAEPFAVARGWHFEDKSREAKRARPPTTTHQEILEWAQVARHLKRWLPRAVIESGSVKVGAVLIRVPEATWSDSVLKATLTHDFMEGQQAILATLKPARPFELELQSVQLPIRGSLSLATNSVGVDVQGAFSWASNSIAVRAHFDPADDLPAAALLDAPELIIPPHSFGLPDYEDLRGSVRAKWEQNRFTADVHARARPDPRREDLPPVQVDLLAAGDTNRVTVRTLQLTAPWIRAELSRELTVFLNGQVVRQPTTFLIEADLAKQPWIKAAGWLRGEVDLTPSENVLPTATFRLAGTDVGTDEAKAKEVVLHGVLDWPWIQIEQGRLTGSDGSWARLEGSGNIETEFVNEGALELHGPLIGKWLPQGWLCDGVALSAIAEGPVSSLAHRGTLAATNLANAQLSPVQLQAEWRGIGRELSTLSASARAGADALALQGSLLFAEAYTEARLSSLTLLTNHSLALALTEPCRILVPHFRTNGATKLELGPLILAGKGGRVQAQGTLDWPRRGDITLSLQRLSSTLLASFSRKPLPVIQLERVEAAVNWDEGPARFQLLVSGVRPELGQPVPGPRPLPPGSSQPTGAPVAAKPALAFLPAGTWSIDLDLTGDASGVVLSNLAAQVDGDRVAAAQGFLPVQVLPGRGTNWLEIDQGQPIQLQASIQSGRPLWDTLERMTGIKLVGPKLNARLGGYWPTPLGEVDFAARQVGWPGAGHNQPKVEDVRLKVLLERDRVRLAPGRVFLQQQLVEVTGEIPLGRGFWNELRQKQMPDLRQAQARVSIPEASLAAFEPLFPKLIAPEGKLHLDLALRPGLMLHGTVDLVQARTRPLGNLGPLRAFNARLLFNGAKLELERASADVGGAGVLLAGEADLGGARWWTGEIPPFQFTLRGTNVALARQPEFILRSDLDLAIHKTNGSPPTVSGVVKLRDSFYLSDLADLLPGKVATPRARPPYFSVEEAPLAETRLAVTVAGVRFLRVRSPLFNGVVSTSLRLQGTAKDPVALGDVKVDSGFVRFPFASFQVQQGLVTLTSQDPYHPHLLIQGASRQFGYDLRLAVNGRADAPVVQFSSTPPLTSEQILLMVTAGEMPSGSFTLTPQQRAQTMALFLGRDVLAKFGIGDQGQQRLTIKSGEQISEQGRPTYDVEYKLSDRWSLTGEYDRFGDFNAGFKWRFYSK